MKRLCISLLAGVAVVAISGCASVVTVSSSACCATLIFLGDVTIYLGTV